MSVTAQSRSAAARASGNEEAAPLSIWLLTNAPSPYQVELLSAIGARDGIELNVRFMRPASRAGQASGNTFAFRVMTGLGPGWLRDEVRLHPQAVWECLRARHHCFVLSGLYTSITFLLCAAILTIRRRPWVLWLEQPHPERREQATWSPALLMARPVRWLRSRVVGTLLRRTSRVIAIGSAARRAYERLGARADRIDMVPYCCELGRFDDVDPADICRLKDEQGGMEAMRFLYSGQMIPRKGVDVLLQAFSRLAKESPVARLILLGDGPQRSTYEESIAVELRSRIHFAGHVAQTDVPAWFRASDVFVFPSRHDGWGVVINEACAARLPVIATRQTGAAVDLVEDGVSGFLVERDDVDGVLNGMRYFLDHPGDRRSFGERSRQLVEKFSPSEGASRFEDAIRAAVAGSPYPARVAAGGVR